ncbi:MAG: hypothetical protein ACI9JR_000992 [Gammaproteobacteria bacterium]|jgi:hypothetical protein
MAASLSIVSIFIQLTRVPSDKANIASVFKGVFFELHYLVRRQIKSALSGFFHVVKRRYGQIKDQAHKITRG